MKDTVNKLLKDSPVARWTALILLALMMFFAYMFVDVLSPLKTMLEVDLGWSSSVFGTVTSSEYFLNVFVFFLIFAGIILDKMGVRFTAILSAIVMVVGAAIKYYAVSNAFVGSGVEHFLSSFAPSFPASAKLACVGFAIFGCGVEMAGITVSKAIVKWFTGKELALAMGIEMAIARLGVFAVFRLSPRIAESFGSISAPVLFSLILLLIGLISFIVYAIMDKKLDKQIGAQNIEPEDPFRVSDIGKLFKSKTFLIVAGLCVLYYSAIFPFQKFASNMLESRLHISSTDASDIFSWFPIGAMILTPLLGAFLDNRGKGATMLILGAILMCCCHLVFALVPASWFSPAVAYSAIILLGVSFSLVPAALWPSVPKLVDNRYLGSAYSVIFWIQNIGLWAFPLLIGATLDSVNPGVGDRISEIKSNIVEINEQKDNLDSLRVVTIEELNKYNSEFTTSDFSLSHKEEAMIAEYVSLISTDINEKIEMLDINYFSKESRTQIIHDLRLELDRLASFSKDSTLLNYPTVVSHDNLVNISSITSYMNVKLDELEEINEDAIYNYTIPMLIFACLGILAFILGIWLKIEDKKKNYGLELPNIKKDK